MMKKSLLFVLLPAALYGALPGSPAGAAKPVLSDSKSAVLQCQDRRIELKADCLRSDEAAGGICTRQSLTFSDGAGRLLGQRVFAPLASAAQDGIAPVEEKVSEVACVATARGAKYIVARMDNGGNCDRCEWVEVFGWDGAAVGSDRDKKKRNAQVTEASQAAFGDDARKIIRKADWNGFYRTGVK